MVHAAPDDPVAAIAEADATGDTAALFGDIRATLGVPVVNLIWRHLATIPGALPWAWSTLEPHFGSGAIADAADSLSNGVDVPSGVAASTALSDATLLAAGLTRADLRQIAMILRSYARSNAMNIIALETLRGHLAGGDNLAPRTAIAARATAAPALREAITGTMPKPLAPHDMTAETRDLVSALNRFGGRGDVLPTMYRHLAHWPPYLALVHVLIAPLHADGRLESLIRSILGESRARGWQLCAALAEASPALPASGEGQVKAALATFVDGPLCKMIAIVALVRAAMPDES